MWLVYHVCREERVNKEITVLLPAKNEVLEWWQNQEFFRKFLSMLLFFTVIGTMGEDWKRGRNG